MENNLLDQEDDIFEKPQKNRPVGIVVICVLMLLGLIATLSLTVSDYKANGLNTSTAVLTISAGISTKCMVGFWMMKRWAVFIYTGLVLINQLLLLIYGGWTIIQFAIPAIVLIVLYRNINKMD